MFNLTPLLAVAQPATLNALDWLMIALYFSILLGVAWWVVRKGKDTATDYFLAGRNLGWWIIGASIFASNIGSEHLVCRLLLEKKKIQIHERQKSTEQRTHTRKRA